MSEKLYASLQRRPQTAEELTELFGADATIILNELLSQQRIQKKEFSEKIFYSVVE